MVLFIFIVSCCIGSFISVVIYRIPLGINSIKGRSFCESCNHTLTFIDTIPIISFLLLKGKCRYCGNPIPIINSLVELVSGIVGILCISFGYDGIILFIVFELLLAISMIDIKYMIIPNSLTFALGIIAVIFSLMNEFDLINRVIGMLVIALPMLVMNTIIKEAFGGGDIKLMISAGYLLGVQGSVLSFYIATILGGLVGVYLVLRKRSIQTHIPFGPFLSIGIMIAFITINAPI